MVDLSLTGIKFRASECGARLVYKKLLLFVGTIVPLGAAILGRFLDH